MSLIVNNLNVTLGNSCVLNNVSLKVADGERVGLVGSSGSGKSMLIRAVTGLLPEGAKVSGSCKLGDLQTVGASDIEIAKLRGKYVGVVFQQANRALNPVLTVEQQISLPLRIHYLLNDDDVHNRVCNMLEKVGLSPKLASKRTFELSGGQQQRVGIATALITYPKLILADEPTTALDSVTQRDVVSMLTSLVDDMGASMLFVTHDFSVLSHSSQRCYVLDSGNLVDSACVKDLLENPKVTSTRILVESARKLTLRAKNSESAFSESASAKDTSAESISDSICKSENSATLLSAKNIHVIFGSGKKSSEVLKGVDLNLKVGESLAIIGGSGSGKTTLIRSILGLQKISEGTIEYDSNIIALSNSKKSDFLALRSETSLVFQHPFAALDPRWTVEKSVAEPLNIRHKNMNLSKEDVNNRVYSVLKLVGLKPENFAQKYPHELSGGQAQCVAIARALINDPRILIADEPMSAIDVAERTRILEAFATIRSKRPNMSCIFVSHDLGMIQHLATRVIVLNDGKIVESGSVSQVLNYPKNSYTRELVNAAIL
ncbi:ABC transporter ATP-binding protein [Gardnerella sp. 2492-Sm]|uniref:ABC transporter ATP-binding protein n=1 Tax=unclassified Gardnerella TaxID=2628112 RepID=UPI003D00DD75